MLRFCFVFILLGLLHTTAEAQINLRESGNIGAMFDRFVQLNRATATVPGWRIQLLATTDRSKMESARQRFQSRYPNITVDWEDARPYYKLRAGAFATKLEAIRLLKILERDYPTAYPAMDKSITPAQLAGYF